MQKPNPRTVNGLVQYTSVNGPVGQVYTSTGPMYVESGLFESVKTPGFKKLKRSQQPMNPFRHTRITDAYTGDGYWKQYATRYSWSRGYLYGQIPAPIAGTSQPIYTSASEADYVAKQKLLSRFRSGSVNVAQMFAERHQTVTMLAKTVNRLSSAAAAIRRGRLVHAHNLLWNYGKHSTVGDRRDFGKLKDIAPSPNNLSNYWLEFAYGWRPLISDIYGACELLADTYYRSYPTKATAKHEASSKKLDYRLRRVSTILWDEMANTVIREKVRYVVEYVEDARFKQIMANTGLSNPALLAWELLPYSFVVDWILPVGSYLENLKRTQGFTFVKGCKTILRTSSTQTYWKAGSYGLGGLYVSKLPTRTRFEYSKERQILTNFPSPSFPPFRPLDKIAQVASGLALLQQSFSKR